MGGRSDSAWQSYMAVWKMGVVSGFRGAQRDKVWTKQVTVILICIKTGHCFSVMSNSAYNASLCLSMARDGMQLFPLPCLFLPLCFVGGYRSCWGTKTILESPTELTDTNTDSIFSTGVSVFCHYQSAITRASSLYLIRPSSIIHESSTA